MNESSKLFERALRVTPGGVHSPVRSFAAVGGQPLFIESAHGAKLTDADGSRYTDFCMAFGPLILGHGDTDVAAAAHAAIDNGWSFGAAERWSLELAELITARVPWAEQIRFVNSGTEAVMSALRLARAATGRPLIVKFAGCYHGHSDAMLIEAGSGMAGIPASAGVSTATAAETLILPLNDIAAVTNAFADHGDRIAAVIIEPLPANIGLLPQSDAYLHELARLCRQHAALLIFDEVISGFRCSFGGRAEQLGIEPDLVTWGKIIGGGFPVGAFAGSKSLMQRIAPSGAVYQAGTLSANPVAMRAGLATLEKLTDGKVYDNLNLLSGKLRDGLKQIPNVSVTLHDSLFWLHLRPADADDKTDVPRTPGQISSDHAAAYAPLFRDMLNAGIYLPPSPHEVGFVSAAHSLDDIRDFIAAIANARLSG